MKKYLLRLLKVRANEVKMMIKSAEHGLAKIQGNSEFYLSRLQSLNSEKEKIEACIEKIERDWA